MNGTRSNKTDLPRLMFVRRDFSSKNRVPASDGVVQNESCTGHALSLQQAQHISRTTQNDTRSGETRCLRASAVLAT